MNEDADDVLFTLITAQQSESQVSTDGGCWSQIQACPPSISDWSDYRINSVLI